VKSSMLVQLKDWLKQLGNPLVYYPKLAKVVGGATAAIFLEYLGQQQGGGTSGWIACAVKDIEAATGLSAREQVLARKQLRDRGILQERLASNSSLRLEFFVNLETLQKKLEVFTRLLFQATPEPPPDEIAIVEASCTPIQPDNTDPFFGARHQKDNRNVIPHYRFAGPWESDEQFEAFQKTLFDYAIAQGFKYPSGWVFKIVDGITKGLISPYWDEFLAAVPLGSTQQAKRDWEVEPGVPYPAFEEERIQYYIHKGEPLESAVAKARAELRNPVVGQDLWDGFLRRCDRLADEAIKAKKLGVQSPYLPPSFTEKPAVSKEKVMQKLTAISSQETLPPSEDAQNSLSPGNSPDEIPPLAVLQTLYRSFLSRSLVEKQIAEHPEWGYAIADGQVIDIYPF
jgi:hypothetical protein